MNKFMKDLTTGKDNQTHDIVRVAMTVVIAMLPFVLLWGICMETYATLYGKTFDLQGSFTAVLAFLTGSGAFLMSGAASLYFKKTTEPDGSVSEEESITKGNQPDVINSTTVIAN